MSHFMEHMESLYRHLNDDITISIAHLIMNSTFSSTPCGSFHVLHHSFWQFAGVTPSPPGCSKTLLMHSLSCALVLRGELVQARICQAMPSFSNIVNISRESCGPSVHIVICRFPSPVTMIRSAESWSLYSGTIHILRRPSWSSWYSTCVSPVL